MKKFLDAMLAFGLTACLATGFHAIEPEEAIQAEAAVLIDADTGQVLYGKNIHDRRHPASITKIMTGLIVVESCSLDEMVEVTDAAADLPYNSSHVSLTPGEQLPVDSAMYAMMLPSANDAANALAEHVAGSQEAFAELMNEKARELGAADTHFVNPSGLPEDEHLTSAYDMALITRAAIRNTDFLKYYGTAKKTIPATNLQPEERNLYNQNFMLVPTEEWAYDESVIGGKVGYTDEARHTMSTTATKDGRTLIAVVMGCGVDQKFYDTQALFAFGFNSFEPVTVPPEAFENLSAPLLEDGERVGEALFAAEGAISMLLPRGASPEDIRFAHDLPESVESGQEPETLVTLTYGSGTQEFQLAVPLTADLRYDSLPLSADPSRISEGASSAKRPLPWPVLIGIPPVAFLLWALVRHRQIRRRATMRKRRQLRLIQERQHRGHQSRGA